MTRANRRRVYEAPLNVDIPVELRQDLDVFCDEKRVKIKAVVEMALRRFITKEARGK